MRSYKNLTPGDPAPWFVQRSIANPRFTFDTAAGRYIVLCFFVSAADPHSHAAVTAAKARPDLFDDTRASFFGVSNDPSDEATRRVSDRYPGFRHFWDFDGSVSRLYGALPVDHAPGTPPIPARRIWVVLDPTLRVLRVVPFEDNRADIAALLDFVEGLPPAAQFPGFEVQAPVLVLPNVFEPAFCARLMRLYDSEGGVESGFMKEIDGKTVGVHDHAHKRRRDCIISSDEMIGETRTRFTRRVVPEIRKAFQFEVTRMERYIVACYAAEDQAHFRAHRDNTTKGTAHRRFAVSVNLNADFDGGEVGFPEYGPRRFKPPPGGAVVFSCSLLHSVSPVTAGRRYAFLPFLYDEASARIRETNNAFLGEGVVSYASGKIATL